MPQPSQANRNLAHQVKALTLKRIKEILLKPKADEELYKSILVRLSGSILPRTTELSGEDGEAISFKLVAYDDRLISTKKVSITAS